MIADGSGARLLVSQRTQAGAARRRSSPSPSIHDDRRHLENPTSQKRPLGKHYSAGDQGLLQESRTLHRRRRDAPPAPRAQGGTLETGSTPTAKLPPTHSFGLPPRMSSKTRETRLTRAAARAERNDDERADPAVGHGLAEPAGSPPRSRSNPEFSTSNEVLRRGGLSTSRESPPPAPRHRSRFEGDVSSGSGDIGDTRGAALRGIEEEGLLPSPPRSPTTSALGKLRLDAETSLAPAIVASRDEPPPPVPPPLAVRPAAGAAPGDVGLRGRESDAATGTRAPHPARTTG